MSIQLSLLPTPIRSQKVADRLRRVAAPAQPHQGRHARVVPAADIALLDQLQELALAHHRVGQVEAGKFVLLRAVDAEQVVQEPVVEGAVVLELQGADGVGDPLDGVATGRGRSRTSDRCTTRRRCGDGWHGVIRYMTGSRRFRLGEAMSILARSTLAPSGNSPARIRRNRSRFSSDGPVPVGALLARLGQGAAVGADLLGGEVVHIGLSLPDQLLGPLVELLEVVGGIVEVLAPVEAEPADALLDRFDVLHLFLGRIGVVEAEVAAAAEIAGQAEVEADGLGMADVQIAVRLRRKAGDDGLVLAALQVLVDDGADEVGRRCGSVAVTGSLLMSLSCIALFIGFAQCWNAHNQNFCYYRLFQQHHRVGGDPFAAAGKAEFLGGGGLDVDPVRLRTKDGGNILPHLRDMGSQLRALGDDGGIDVAESVTLVIRQRHDVAQAA